MEELERAIPLCLPDNYSWDEETNECIKQSENRSSYKLENTALRRLEAIQGPVCVVAVVGPTRKGKSFILSQPFAGNREIFPLGHGLELKTVGLWMWVVPEKYHDSEGNEFTVVLIDTEGIDSTVADKNDDVTILTLAILLSSVLIYNSAGVPASSDLEGLRFAMMLCQRIQVFTAQKTTSVQAQMVFPSFMWLLRDSVLHFPQDCKDLTEYFLKHVFHSTTYNSQDQAQQVKETLLNFFPSFEAFSLPVPSFDSEILQDPTHPSNQSAFNPIFWKNIEKFSKVLKAKLGRKRTPDGKSYVTGEALSSMVQSYVNTLNTPGSVQSISGAWEQYIGREGHTIYQIANAVYFNEMKDRLETRLPCDFKQIRLQHTMILQHVMVNVFEATVESKGMSAEQLAKYAKAFQAEAEEIESSWLQKNSILTENNCETVFKEVKREMLTRAKGIWRNQGEAERRIRSAYEGVIGEFKRRCRGCKEIIDKLAVLYKEELDKEMHHYIGIVRQFGDKKNESYARQLHLEEIKALEDSLKAMNIVLKEDIEDIDKQVRELQIQHLDVKEMGKQAEENLSRQRQRLETILIQNEDIARRQIGEIEENTQKLERRRDELQQALESEGKLKELKREFEEFTEDYHEQVRKKEKHGKAIPLVLPNDVTWDSSTWNCKIKPGVKYEKLEVSSQALDQLRKIEGPVCVVAIAGAVRQGKSYVISRVFDQEQVFPLGHSLYAQTFGIWLWIVPKKFKDSNGQEFTVVLLDSEGTDSPSRSDDNKIFTLVVLLSSILIYNSSGVPYRSQNLDFIVKLSERIQLTKADGQRDEIDFHDVFPCYIWLLRDILFRFPEECHNTREFFTKNVLNRNKNTEGSRMTAWSIFEFFSCFDAFSLPVPTFDVQALSNLDERKSDVSPEFHKQFEVFKDFLHTKLSPKKSIKKGELVTGEGLAALVEYFVEAVNTPGAVPNVQSAWDTFVHWKCSKILECALKKYKQEMVPLVEQEMPCEADVLRSAHKEAMEKCHQMFKKETSFLNIESVETYFKEMTVKTETLLNEWLQENIQKTKESCNELIKDLKKSILDPVLSRLASTNGSQIEFKDLIDAYDEIEQRYRKESRGDLVTKGVVSLNIHSMLNEEMTQHWEVLKPLKNYDALLAKEKTQNAILEQQNKRAKEEIKCVEEEKNARQNELDFFCKKQEEEKVRLRLMLEKNWQDQREQIKNMMEANFDEQRKDREAAFARQKTLEDCTELSKKNLKIREEKLESLKKEMMAKSAQAKKDEEDMIRMFQETMEKDRQAARENVEEIVKKSYHDVQDMIKEVSGKERELNRDFSAKLTITAGEMERSSFGERCEDILNYPLHNVSRDNEITDQDIANLKQRLHSVGTETWKYALSEKPHGLNDKYNFLTIALGYNFLKPKLEEFERKNQPARDDAVDLTFLAHGGVRMPLIPCALLYVADTQIESINLYVPWGCKLDASAAYGIATGKITKDNIAYNGFYNEAQRVKKKWPNELPRDWTEIPNVVFTRVSADNEAIRRLKQIDTIFQNNAEGIFVPFFPTENSIQIPTSLWSLCSSVSLIGLELDRKYRIHIASCLSHIDHGILVPPQDPNDLFPKVNCTQYWGVPVSDSPVTMTCTPFDLIHDHRFQNVFYHLNNDFLNKP